MEAQSVAIPLFVLDSTRCSRLSSGPRKAAIVLDRGSGTPAVRPECFCWLPRLEGCAKRDRGQFAASGGLGIGRPDVQAMLEQDPDPDETIHDGGA
jgi:hypothetical protein